MRLLADPPLLWLFSGILGLLVVASAIGWILAVRAKTPEGQATLANFNTRTNAWWVMCGVFACATALGPHGTIAFFALSSFLALRELSQI